MLLVYRILVPRWVVDSYLPAGVGDLATGLADCREGSAHSSKKIYQVCRVDSMDDVDIPFKLIISLIVIESMFFQAKKSGRGK